MGARTGIRLLKGTGFVRGPDWSVVRPVDTAETSVYEAELSLRASSQLTDETACFFHVVDTTHHYVAVLDSSLSAGPADKLLVALADHYPIVVDVHAQAEGVAVGTCYGSGNDTENEAAIALWALKALGGWDESPKMAFGLTHQDRLDSRRSELFWVSSEANWSEKGWEVCLESKRTGSWAEVGAAVLNEPSHVVGANVDWMKAYNDAQGHHEGDLVLVRVEACLRDVAADFDAECFRVGGDEFVLVGEGLDRREAESLAHDALEEVQDLQIPFELSYIKTHGILTLSLAVVAARDLRGLCGDDVTKFVRDAVYQAKKAGRNCVHVSSLP